MLKLLIILLIALVFETIGVILLSEGLKEIPGGGHLTVSSVKTLAVKFVTSRKILAGVFFEAIFFAGLLLLMSKGDVSFVWPLTSLGFVFMTVAAKYVLGENVSAARWAGVCLIMAGAALVSWTEHNKELKQHPPAPAAEIRSPH